MKKRLLILPVIAAMALGGCDLFSKKEQGSEETPSGETAASVVSITVSSPKGKVYDSSAAFKLTATVTVTGNASKLVTWSSSNTSVATVNSSTGQVTPKAPGSVTITATSTFDTTKSGSVTFTILDGGYAGDLIAEGYEYVSAWPASQIKTLTVVEPFSITDSQGFYVSSGQTSSGQSYVSVACDYTEANADKIEAALEEFGYFYDDYNEIDCYIDPTISYEVDVYPTYASETSSQIVIMFDFYLSTAYFSGSKTDTTDTAWSSEAAAEIAKVHESFSLPFVKLGEDYEAEYDDGILYINDGSPDYKKLNGYGAVLEAAEFEKVEVQGGAYYRKDLDKYSFAVVTFGFTADGNVISVDVYLSELEEYPGQEVADFIDDVIESKYEISAFSSETAVYTYQEVTKEISEDDERDAIVVGVYGATEAECMTFVGALQADGFEVVESSTETDFTEEGFRSLTLQKGKIVVEAYLSYWREATDEELDEFEEFLDTVTEEVINAMTDEEYEAFMSKYIEYIFTGTFSVLDLEGDPEASLTVYGDPDAHEVPGLYVKTKNVKVSTGKTLTLEVEAFELGENPTISYVSSETGVATVDENGVVTAVALGTTTITASTDYNEEHYEVEIIVEVVNEVTDSITLAKLFPSTTIGTTYTAFSKVSDNSDAKYSGCCAGNYSSIQLRSKNKDAALYSEVSGGTIVSVTVAFNSNDTSTKALNVVASNEPFTSIEAIHNATPVGTITPSSTTYTFEAAYSYVAIVSSDGAHYLDSVSFVWAA